MRLTHLSAPAAAAAAVIAIASFAASVSGQDQVPPPPVPAFQPTRPQGQPRLAPQGQGSQGQGRRGRYIAPTPRTPTGPTVKLPEPRAKSTTSIEQALWNRQTLRAVTPGPVALDDVGQLLWAAQGVTGRYARRAAPSAGGAYALEVLLVAGDVTGLPAGVYRYYGASNQLESLAPGDKRPAFSQITRFEGIQKAPAIVVITAVRSRTTQLFPTDEIADHFLSLEVGAAGQNLMLEAVALHLGTSIASDTDEKKLVDVLGTPADERPYMLIVVARD
ncbi:MAG TPA: SagB/ThcOx family dehydrogenase [Thermoanaerobaculaceae bacterium]|nr:SagB/ThcOx family dehydrogenase [Thermoanaerobaculaceae bacterium]